MTEQHHNNSLQQYRCSKCNRLLFKGQVKYVEIQCPKCNLVQTIKKGKIFTAYCT